MRSALAALTAMFTLSAALVAAPASASIYTDDLGRCLVAKSSKADRTYLMQWVFAAMSADVRGLSKVTAQQQNDYAVGTGKLMTRLLTVDCRTETVAAVKYDGPAALRTAFELLGQVAMQDMMTDPAVSAELEKLDNGSNINALTSVFAEAGPKVPAPAKGQ